MHQKDLKDQEVHKDIVDWVVHQVKKEIKEIPLLLSSSAEYINSKVLKESKETGEWKETLGQTVK